MSDTKFLIWDTDLDGLDNTLWVAASRLGDDGCRFEWRIIQVFKDDKLFYSLQESDDELLTPQGAMIFADSNAAMAECERQEAQLIAEFMYEPRG